MATIVREGIHGQVVRQLGMRVLRGDVRPGETFPREEALSNELGVSRTVVREAIKVLQAKGLVASKPKTGTHVRQQQEWNLLDAQVLEWRYEAKVDEHLLHDLTEVRRIIEPPAAALAAVRASPEHIESMERWFALMEKDLEDDEDFINADMGFHMAILAASRNSILQQMNRAINLVLRISRTITVAVPGSSEASMPFHWAILEAIRDRDATASQVRMEELLEHTAHDISLAMEGVSPQTGRTP